MDYTLFLGFGAIPHLLRCSSMITQMEKEMIYVNGLEYPVNIHYEWRNSTRVSITKSGINIRVPRTLGIFKRQKVIGEMKNWAVKKLIKIPDLVRRDEPKKYVSGDTIEVFGVVYVIEISLKDAKKSSGKINDNIVYLRISKHLAGEDLHKDVSNLLSRVFAKRHYNQITARVHAHNNTHFNKRINKISLKNHKSKWGSCSSYGNINLSTRLFFAPTKVLDYVIIHELAHLVEHNHSRNFWNHVERAMPDYKEKKKWLNDHGHKCKF